MSAAERSLAEREYEATVAAGALQAPNRAQDVRTYFTAQGIRMVDRTSPGSPELLRLRVVQVGRAGQPAAVAAAGHISAQGNRVVNERAGLRETYVNSKAGLAVGVELDVRPPGIGPLVWLLRVGAARVERAPIGVALIAANGRRLEMTRLPATDATGRPLPSRLEVAGPRLVRVSIDDAMAVYPVSPTLLITNTADARLESNQADAELGSSVAGAGDVNGDGYADVIVGAPSWDGGELNEGAAFIFLGGPAGTGSGSPSTAATVLQSDQAHSHLGASVAGAGDVNGDGYADVIVGAPEYDHGQTDEGAAFVFLGGAAGIPNGNPSSASAMLETNQASVNGFSSVAGAGDVNGDGYADVIVGLAQYDVGQPGEGAAFVFLGSSVGIASGGPLSAATRLYGDQADGYFGFSVAGAGDVDGDGYSDVIVGAYGYDIDQADAGMAFVFLGSAAGIASGNSSTASANFQSKQASACLGWSVGGAGDVNGDGYADVIVGAPFYNGGQTGEGAAFVFLGSQQGIASGSPLTAATILQSNQAGAQMGVSVAGAGDVNGDGYADVIVAARQYDHGQTDEGAAFVFAGGAAGVASGGPPSALASFESDQAGAGVYMDVAGAGDVDGDGYADVIVGIPEYDSGEVDEGAAFVMLGGAAWTPVGSDANASSILRSNQAGANLGVSVAGAGDVNADGFADVIVGAKDYDSGQPAEGAAFVFLGSPSGLPNGNPATAATTLQSNQSGAGMGTSVAGVGDVNGDGYADVIVGAPGWGAGEGAAFVFLGGASGIANGSPATASATLLSNQAGSSFGTSVAGAGDVNGDGYPDVIVGAPRYQSSFVQEGAAFIFLGGASGVASGNPSTAATVLRSDQGGGNLGRSVAGAGDVNGDGFADVIVGAPLYNSGQVDEGAAFVFLGGLSGIASGTPTRAAAILQSNQAGAQFGWSVAGAGDVNGDGFADVIVGAPFYGSSVAPGGAFIFKGGASGVGDGDPSTAAAGLAYNLGAEFGYSVAGAGDVNGDGYADVIVGAPYSPDPSGAYGVAFIFSGGAGGISGGLFFSPQLQSTQAGSEFGWSVAGAGDVNGDGYADVIVGAPNYDSGQTDEGEAFVFIGNRAGRAVRAQQWRGGATSLPVQPWGSGGAASFVARLNATDPLGRGRVKLEVEACPAGKDFGAAECTSSISGVWTDVRGYPFGPNLGQTVSNLGGTLYHWRERVLHAPFGIDQPGITSPPHPAHGPWRRVNAQAVEADLHLTGGAFHTLSPCRVVDTRPASGAPIGGPILTSTVARTLQLRGNCGIPFLARAVSVNVTVVGPTGPGFLTIYPVAGQPSATSTLNFGSGQTRANNAILVLDGSGAVQVNTFIANPAGADEVHLLLDVSGYFD